MSKWSKEYNILHPNIKTTTTRSDPPAVDGQQFVAKTVSFGASDAPMTDGQLTQAGAANVVHIPVSQGSAVIAYNVEGVSKQLRFGPETIAGMVLGTDYGSHK